MTLFDRGEPLPWLDLDHDVAPPSQPPAARERMEQDIISLAGSVSYIAGPVSGRVQPDHDEAAIAAAVRSLERLALAPAPPVVDPRETSDPDHYRQLRPVR